MGRYRGREAVKIDPMRERPRNRISCCSESAQWPPIRVRADRNGAFTRPGLVRDTHGRDKVQETLRNPSLWELVGKFQLRRRHLRKPIRNRDSHRDTSTVLETSRNWPAQIVSDDPIVDRTLQCCGVMT